MEHCWYCDIALIQFYKCQCLHSNSKTSGQIMCVCLSAIKLYLKGSLSVDSWQALPVNDEFTNWELLYYRKAIKCIDNLLNVPLLLYFISSRWLKKKRKRRKSHFYNLSSTLSCDSFSLIEGWCCTTFRYIFSKSDELSFLRISIIVL